MGQLHCCCEDESGLKDAHEPPRVHVFTVKVHKNGGTRLGLDLDFVKGREVLPVRAVTGHLIEEWNRDHPENKVQSGDRIVEVNGIRGRSDLLMKALMVKDDLLKITLVRAERTKDSKFPIHTFQKRSVFQEQHGAVADDEDDQVCSLSITTPTRASTKGSSGFSRPVTEQLIFAVHEITSYQTYDEAEQILTSLSASFSGPIKCSKEPNTQ